MISPDRLLVQVFRSPTLGWAVNYGGLLLGCNYLRQRAAVRAARAAVADHVSAGGKVQIIIHKADGRIQRDITLPRSSDPRRTKG